MREIGETIKRVRGKQKGHFWIETRMENEEYRRIKKETIKKECVSFFPLPPQIKKS